MAAVAPPGLVRGTAQCGMSALMTVLAGPSAAAQRWPTTTNDDRSAAHEHHPDLRKPSSPRSPTTPRASRHRLPCPLDSVGLGAQRGMHENGTLRSTEITYSCPARLPVCVAHDGDGPSITDRPMTVPTVASAVKTAGNSLKHLCRKLPPRTNMDISSHRAVRF